MQRLLIINVRRGDCDAARYISEIIGLNRHALFFLSRAALRDGTEVAIYFRKRLRYKRKIGSWKASDDVGHVRSIRRQAT